MIAAAEAAAVTAAETAAATAAQTAAAEAAAAAATQASQAAAAEAATSAAIPEVASAVPEIANVAPEATGILEAAPGAAPPPTQPLPPAGLEQVAPAGSTPLPPSQPMPPAGEPGMQQVNSMQSNTFNPEARPGMELTDTGFQPTGEMQQPSGLEQVKAAPGQSGTLGPNGQVTMPDGSTMPWEQYSQSQGFDPSIKPPSEPNPFLQGAKDVGNWMDSNPFKTGAAAYLGLQYTGAFDQKGASMSSESQGKKTFNNPYSMSPDFKGGPYSEPNVYKPKTYNYAAGGIAQINGPVEQMSANALGGNANMYPQSQQQRTYFATPTQMPASAEVTMNNQYQGVTMAQGGIARYAEGDEVEERPTRRYRGNLMGTLDKYNEMIEGKKSGSLPSGKSDPYTGEVGTFTDSDADTRLQDAYTASLTRLKKNNKRANVDVAALPAGTQAGTLSMSTRQAAGGGIMQASLGGYAAGGNPRLLNGPGDGMSDNIPATIGGKQPARLADGEFVVPADVVSHLGNGSTNAGAKKLHSMMDKVRMDRTGKKKQAPAVKAKKYMPK
jgi:hypothetical protein